MAGGRDYRLEALLRCTQEYDIPGEQDMQKLPDTIKSQRQTAAEVLLYLADAYNTEAGTLLHAFVLLDRFIAAHSRQTLSDKVDFIQASVACFLISIKLHDVHHLAIRDLRELTSFPQEQIIESEITVLSSLDWNIISTTGNKSMHLGLTVNNYS